MRYFRCTSTRGGIRFGETLSSHNLRVVDNPLKLKRHFGQHAANCIRFVCIGKFFSDHYSDIHGKK